MKTFLAHPTPIVFCYIVSLITASMAGNEGTIVMVARPTMDPKELDC